MTPHLLDANVLIALVVSDHEHHDRASRWLTQVKDFAVCPVVEGALVRFLLRIGESATTASHLVQQVNSHPNCQFWADEFSYGHVDLSDVRGHRQVTDVYLASLAASKGSRLATFDTALARLRPDATVLVP